MMWREGGKRPLPLQHCTLPHCTASRESSQNSVRTRSVGRSVSVRLGGWVDHSGWIRWIGWIWAGGGVLSLINNGSHRNGGESGINDNGESYQWQWRHQSIGIACCENNPASAKWRHQRSGGRRRKYIIWQLVSGGSAAQPSLA